MAPRRAKPSKAKRNKAADPSPAAPPYFKIDTTMETIAQIAAIIAAIAAVHAAFFALWAVHKCSALEAIAAPSVKSMYQNQAQGYDLCVFGEGVVWRGDRLTFRR